MKVDKIDVSEEVLRHLGEATDRRQVRKDWSGNDYMNIAQVVTRLNLAFNYDWDWERPDIGYRLEEGSKDEFNRSLEKAETIFKKFDEDHNTDFSKNSIIYSYCSV